MACWRSVVRPDRALAEPERDVPVSPRAAGDHPDPIVIRQGVLEIQTTPTETNSVSLAPHLRILDVEAQSPLANERARHPDSPHPVESRGESG